MHGFLKPSKGLITFPGGMSFYVLFVQGYYYFFEQVTILLTYEFCRNSNFC